MLHENDTIILYYRIFVAQILHMWFKLLSCNSLLLSCYAISMYVKLYLKVGRG